MGEVFPAFLVNLEPAVTADRTGAVVVGAGLLDDFELVEVFENVETFAIIHTVPPVAAYSPWVFAHREGA